MGTIRLSDAIKIEGGIYPENPIENQLYFDVVAKKYVWHVNGSWINYRIPFGWIR